MDLGQAKIIIREKVVVGLLDENLDESVNRMVAYGLYYLPKMNDWL